MGAWNNDNTSILNYENSLAPKVKTFSVNTAGNIVNYSGAADQNIRPETYHNLTISGESNKSISDNTIVNGILNMTSGNVTTGPNTLILQNSDFTSLNYTSGVIIGQFERFIDQTSQNYFFPVGIAGQIHSLTCNFLDLTNGSLLVEYFSDDPGNSGLPLN